jgi:hypothetical protein
MKDYVIIGLLIVILVIIFSRHLSLYTAADINIPLPVERAVHDDLLDIIINETKGIPVMSSVNSLISKVNMAEPSAQLVPYTSEEQIATMFETAYKNGESSLTRTDKAILRFMMLFGLEMQQLPWGSAGLPALSYTNEGTPVWADEVLAQTGLSIRDGIVKVMELAKLKDRTTVDDDFIRAVNAALPSNLTAFSSINDYLSKVSAKTDPSIVWLIKFVSIGPLYILWVATNKWRIDSSWRLVQNSTPSS